MMNKFRKDYLRQFPSFLQAVQFGHERAKVVVDNAAVAIVKVDGEVHSQCARYGFVQLRCGAVLIVVREGLYAVFQLRGRADIDSSLAFFGGATFDGIHLVVPVYQHS